MEVIARIHTDFPEKFGIPRQSGLVEELEGVIVFTPKYRDPDALRGLEGFSHLWLIWEFSQAVGGAYHPTVRPPRLGGNQRMGVFATRSPFRPNPIGLSCVRLGKIEYGTPVGPRIHVFGADLLDGTPLYDIKPYLPFTDAHPEARDGFAGEHLDYALSVECPDRLLQQVPERLRTPLLEILAQDPRPSYQEDPAREYGLALGEQEVRFRVADGVLTVTEVRARPGHKR